MTEQEKQLLLKDLCARLSYGVLMQVQNCKEECKHHLLGINFEDNTVRIDHCNESDEKIYISDWMPISDCKLYLRPMSSMTEEEWENFRRTLDGGDCEINDDGETDFIMLWFEPCQLKSAYNCLDYLNSIHIDYHGLIEKGLALEAPEGMYKN